MEDNSSNGNSEQSLREAKKEVELEYFRTKEDFEKDPQISGLQKALQEDILNLFKEIKTDVQADVSAEVTFKSAFGSLDKLEQKRFVLDNLLERLKKGETPARVLHRFQNLGLIDLKSVETKWDEYIKLESGEAERPSSSGWGKFIKRQISNLRRFGATVGILACSAFKTLPKFLKIVPAISFLGPIPLITFNLGGEDLNLQELLDTIKAAWMQSGMV
jgi:hypothetical protein